MSTRRRLPLGQTADTTLAMHDEVARLLNARGIPAVADATAQVAGPDQLLVRLASEPVATYQGPEFWPDFGVQVLTRFMYGFAIPRLYPVAQGVTYDVDFAVTERLRPLMRDGAAPATSAFPPAAESARSVGAQ